MSSTDPRVLVGDCREVMRQFEDNSFHAIVSDPPYEIAFMGKGWDNAGVAFDKATWVECLRILKPGGYLLSFGATRTYHRMACAIEDAGFEIRDSLHWVYGSGFPKSLDVSKAIDKAAGTWRGRAGPSISSNGSMSGANLERTDKGAPVSDEAQQWAGWGTALKPSHEPIVVARKPLSGTVAANVLKHGTGALNVDGCRVGDAARLNLPRGTSGPGGCSATAAMGGSWRTDATAQEAVGRWPTNIVFSHDPDCVEVGTRQVKGDSREGGDGTRDGGFGDVRGETDGNGRPAGRLYGNEQVPVFECAEGCPVAELDAQSGDRKAGGNVTGRQQSRTGESGIYGHYDAGSFNGYQDDGGASRFFPCFRYQAKASASERPRVPPWVKVDGERLHATVKPVDLMRWLIRLVTPPGGTILDPFAGSGTTLQAALLEGVASVGIEQNPAYADLIRRRLDAGKLGL